MMNRGMLNPILYTSYTPQPIWPGIYHNPTAWLISLSSDGTNRTTIADKNLGATQVYNDGDELSQDNCWNYYQWGNNYWFPFDWNFEKDSTQVDASNYWPYYYSDTFILTPSSPRTWMTTQNNNVWGWTTGTNEAMKWPCQEWYHIPTNNENSSMVSILGSLWLNIGNWECLRIYLKIPYAWYRWESSWNPIVQWYMWWYWSSKAYNNQQAKVMEINSSQLYPNFEWYISIGRSIRPFKNEVVIPDSSWTVLYQGTWNAWIYHNPTLGVISISANGTDWITIADKNLWATKVYNDWDVLSEENCWKY